VRLRHRLVCVRTAVVPSRAIGWLEKQRKLPYLFAGRDRLPSPLISIRGLDRLSTAFRYNAIIRLLSSLHHLVLSFSVITARGFHRCGGREASPGKNAELRVKPSPIRLAPRRISGFADGRQLNPGARRLTALHFRSIPHSTLDFHRTLPRGSLPPSWRPCLFGAGFPPSGSPEDFHLLFRAHAGRTLRDTSLRSFLRDSALVPIVTVFLLGEIDF
jgi:hypothetical protein